MRLALFAAALLVPSPTAAGEPSTGESLEVREASHRVEVTQEGRVARFRIVRGLVSRDQHSEEASLEVELPAEGAAVGLRARAGGRWHGGRLFAADAADARYQALTQGEPSAGLGAALLTWSDTEQVTLSAFPFSRRHPAEAEITAVAPLCYAQGLAVAYYRLPTADWMKAPVFQVRSPHRHWLVRPAAKAPPAIASRWDQLAERCGEPGFEGSVAVVFETEPPAPVTAAVASFDLVSGRRLVWVEVETARELARLPRAGRVLFVLDGSRSVGADGMAAQLDLVRGYLAEAPDAEFEIVVYRRRASRLFGRFRPGRRAKDVLGRVPAGALALDNGSHLDAGLALAGQLARGAREPVRVIAFSDDRVRGALDARAMAAALGRLPAGSIAHLVELSVLAGNDFEWQRDDEHPFAAAVKSTGGMLVSMSGDQPATARAAMRGLVRPLRIDGFAVDGFGIGSPEMGDMAGVLDESGALPAGAGLRVTRLFDAGASRDPLVVRGQIWGRQLALPVAVDRGLEAALPAFLFGSSRWSELDQAEQLDAARRGGVVSPATSFLVELDDRPTGPDEMVGAWGCGCGGGSSHSGTRGGSGSIGRGRRGPIRPEPDRQALLEGALAAPLAACAARYGDAPLAVIVETTLDEVVDVAVETRGPSDLATCAVDAAWAVSLPAAFDQEHATFRVASAADSQSRQRRARTGR